MDQKKRKRSDSFDEDTFDYARYQHWLIHTLQWLPHDFIRMYFPVLPLRDEFEYDIKHNFDIICLVPQEIGLHIFSYGIQPSFRKVCKTWKNLCEIILLKDFEKGLEKNTILHTLMMFQSLFRLEGYII